MINPNEYKSRVGLDKLFVALVTQDDALGYATGTPEYLAPAAEASLTPTVNSETQYADDQPFDVASGEGDTAINLTVTGIPPQVYAKLTGAVYDAATGRVFDNASGIAPYFALGFRSKKSNGSHRYFWFLKTRFAPAAEEAATKGETPDIKTQQIECSAIRTVHQFVLSDSITDSVKRVWGDEDSENFDASNWFDAVQTPDSVVIDPLELSESSPVDEATDVAISINPTLTFNNSLQPAAVNGISLFELPAADPVDIEVSLDATKKVITVTPGAPLENLTDYVLAYAVTDVYGQPLNGAVNFTTVAL